MITPRRMTLVAAAVAALVPPGCGGGGGGVDTHTRAGASPATVARANANCRYFLRQTKRLGKGVLSGVSDTLELTTERLVKPSIPLLERVAKRQQALEAGADDPQFDLYANLFDPVIVLAQQRLRTGEAGLRTGHELEAAAQSKKLEDLMTGLGLEQRQAARGAGLGDCDIDFRHVLVSSLTG